MLQTIRIRTRDRNRNKYKNKWSYQVRNRQILRQQMFSDADEDILIMNNMNNKSIINRISFLLCCYNHNILVFLILG